MLSPFREDSNARFTPEKYQRLLARLSQRCRTHVGFRVAETPCFFPKALIDEMASAGMALTKQLVDSPAYMQSSSLAVPAAYRVPNESRHPNFMTVDFGVVRNPDGSLSPRLVELQAFPSMYGYQAILCQEYADVFGLDDSLRCFLGGHDTASYWSLLRKVIVGNHDPENVVLAEIEPEHQKTLPDFNATEDQLGICTVNISGLVRKGNKLYYERDGRLAPIHRIYNRAIVDELERKRVTLPFDYRDELDVEWAGHPNWYFRISKFSIPYLRHPTVPPAVFLDDWFAGKGRDLLPENHEQWVFKPLYSFAGKGIEFGPSDASLASVPAAQRHDYLLQQRVRFEPVIETPWGITQAEVRILYIWPEGEDMQPVINLVRLGRGQMMGVDHIGTRRG